MSEAVHYETLSEAIAQTVAAASTAIPADVGAALERAYEAEVGAASRSALGFIVENNRLARAGTTPICQDTGYPTFYVSVPGSYDKGRIRDIIVARLQEATGAALLRPNSVDPVTGRNAGDNTGLHYPAIYFDEVEGETATIRLLLKGGGSENVSTQYKLPEGRLGAGRDLNGVYKVVLDAVQEAQGFGCAPGILGVAIGADRAQGYALAKKQLLRPLDDTNPDQELAALEARILKAANSLGIGAMGFGGATTLLGAKVGKAHRHPASFFVTIAYGCWALRRKTLTITGTDYRITD